MPHGIYSLALWLTAGLVVYQTIFFLIQRRDTAKTPPGPSAFSLLSSKLWASPQPLWKMFRKWSDKYGSDIICLKVLGGNLIILNTLKAATDLLDKRSGIYSDRPISGMTMSSELCGLGRIFVFQRYGEDWRNGRKTLQHELNTDAIRSFRPTKIAEAHKLLRHLLKTPTDFRDHMRRMSAGLVLGAGYGIEIQEDNDPYVAMSQKTLDAIEAAVLPGSYLVDFIPALKYIPEWFPGAEFKTQARIWREGVMDMIDKPWEVVKERMKSDPDGGPDCAVKSLLEGAVKSSEDPAHMEEVMKKAIASFNGGGFDTTLSVLSTFMLAMVLYPDVQRRAQICVDHVCEGRLPSFSDYDSMAYIHAIIKECLRWHPVVPLNAPHRSTEDDVYDGYHIPEGSTVVVNHWAILHDPEVWSNPEQFNPERFLKLSKEDGTYSLNPDVPNPQGVAFGFGRRICPGRYMAYESAWVIVASILATLNVEKATDSAGNLIIPAEDYTSGFVVHPKPFPCKITPRSATHEALILGTVEDH